MYIWNTGIFDSIISYFFYPSVSLINIFENCLNIGWVSVLSGQVLHGAYARRGLTVQEMYRSPCEGQRDREQGSLTPVKGEWKEGLGRKSGVLLRRSCPGWWWGRSLGTVAYWAILMLDQKGLTLAPTPCLVSGWGQQGGSMASTWTLVWIQWDDSRRLLVNSVSPTEDCVEEDLNGTTPQSPQMYHEFLS